MKKVCLFSMFLVCFYTMSLSQIIGTGTITQRYPFSQYDYSRSAALYLGTEIGTTGKITSLAWSVASEQMSYDLPIKIYLKIVTESSLSTGISWNTLKEDATLVFDGSKQFPNVGWNAVDITDFDYCAGGNLLVLCETNSAQGGFWGKFNASSISGMHIAGSNGSSVSSANSNLNVLAAQDNRPNIQISISPCVECNGTELASPVVVLTGASGELTLTWAPVSNASSYSLIWNGGAAETVTSPVVKTGLNNGITYSYSLIAVGNGNTFCDSDPAVGSAKPGVQPPPCSSNSSASDICNSATHLCNFNGYCGSTRGSEYTEGTEITDYGENLKLNCNNAGVSTEWGNILTNDCSLPFEAAVDNDSWLSFTAAATTLDLDVFVSGCTGTNKIGQLIDGNGIQIQIFHTNDCQKFTWGYLNSTSSGPLNFGIYNPGVEEDVTLHITNLEPGEKYFVYIDGYNGDQCDYVIGADDGSIIVPTVSSDVTIGCGETAQLQASGGITYKWSPADGLSATDIANPIANPTTTTTYTVTISGDCDVNATEQVTVTVNGIVATASNNGPLCNGQTLNLTAPDGGTSYQWTGPNGFTSSLQNPSIANVSVSNGGIYTVSVAGSCAGTASTEVVVSPDLTINISPATPSICKGSSTTLTASGATSYLWSGTSLSSNSVSNPIANPSSTTTYTVTGTNNGCTGTANVTLTVNSLPSVSAIASNMSICAGDPVSLTAAGAQTYKWNDNTTANPKNVTPSATTTYNVTGTDNNGCTNTAAVSVTVVASPTVQLSASPTLICAGSASTLTASGADTYLWSTGETQNSISVKPLTSSIYSVTGSRGSCTVEATITVNVSQNVNMSATASPMIICKGQTSNLEASGATMYQWNNAATLNNTNIINPIATPTATTTYVVTGTQGACSGTTQVTVVVKNLPSISATAMPTAICSGESTILMASGATTYLWNNTETLNNSSIQNPMATPSSSTAYTVVGTKDGCTNSATVSVVVNSLPVVSLIADHNKICIGNSATITPSGAVSYFWTHGSNENPLIVKPTSETTYSVIGTDANNCTGSASISIDVATHIDVDVTPDVTEICIGETSSLVANSTGSNVNYIWNIGLTTNSVIVNPTSSMSYIVTGTDEFGCTGSATAKVIVNPLPIVAFSATPREGCLPLNVNFSNNIGSNISEYKWTFGDGSISTEANPAYSYSTPGFYDVSLEITNDKGCSNKKILSGYIHAAADPTAAFSSNITVTTEDEPNVQFVDLSSGAVSWLWNFGDGKSNEINSMIQNPSHVFSGAGSYDVSLTVTNNAGCIDSTKGSIVVKPSYTFYIPNSFSPNGDGLNDVLIPLGIGWNIDNYSMVVYDRWGKILFRSSDINHGWDGTCQGGDIVEQGVYAVRVVLNAADGSEHEYVQHVTLIF